MNILMIALISIVAAMPFTFVYYSLSTPGALAYLRCIALGVATVYVIGALLWVTGLGAAL